MFRYNRYRISEAGEMLVELFLALLVLIPLALFLLDIAAVIIANQVNDQLAKRACRAAANQVTLAQAQKAVEQIALQFKPGGIFNKLESLDVIQFDSNGSDGVRVRSILKISLPVPVPLTTQGTSVSFRAEAHEPIVALGL